MKNIIEPGILEAFRKNPPSYEEISLFLENRPEITATYFCKVIDVNIRQYYDWKHYRKKIAADAAKETTTKYKSNK